VEFVRTAPSVILPTIRFNSFEFSMFVHSDITCVLFKGNHSAMISSQNNFASEHGMNSCCIGLQKREGDREGRV
jgi:hypothetical protein